MSGLRRAGRVATKVLALGLLVVLCAAVAAALFVRSSWGKDRLRALAVSQANRYLTGTLEIGRLDGSLLGGVNLHDVRLSREGQPIFSADTVTVGYSLAELLQDDLRIREIRVVRPRIIVTRDPQGRWNLADLVRRRESASPSSGPGRPLHLAQISLEEGTVSIAGDRTIGAAHLPATVTGLNGRLAYARVGGRWSLTFEDLSFDAHDPDLALERLSGSFSREPAGWSFEDVEVRTPRGALAVSGRVDTTADTTLDLDVRADPIAFQEWAGIVPGLRRLAVEARLALRLQGPPTTLSADVDLQSDGGDVRAALVLNATVPGWHATGSAALSRFDLARWLDDPGHASRITGEVDLDLDLNLGRGFPRGTFTFDGSEARYASYEGTNVRASGILTDEAVEIGEADATAYGARVRLTAGTIGFDDPQPFEFHGHIGGLDLRRLPATIPVPRFATMLSFDFDVTGRFESPAIAGKAAFGPSTALGASLGAGATGAIDTTVSPMTYEGEGEITDLSLERLATDLDIAWLADPRYHGTVSGRFFVQAAGTDTTTMTLTGGGRLSRAALPGGLLSDADVNLSIGDGTLAVEYAGTFADLDPAVFLGDPQYAALVTGTGRVDVTLQDFFVHSPALADVVLETDLHLDAGTIRGIAFETSALKATLADGTLQLREGSIAGPALEAQASGSLVLVDEGTGTLTYRVSRADLGALSRAFEASVEGSATTEGRLTGSWSRLRAIGQATMGEIRSDDIRALSVDAQYDATFTPEDLSRTTASVDGRATFVEAFGQVIDEMAGTAAYDAGTVQADLRLSRPDVAGRIAGIAHLPGGNRVDLSDLRLDVDEFAWQLARTGQPATITWDAEGVAMTPIEFVHASDDTQRVRVAGTWRHDGSGALHVTTSTVAIEALPVLGGESPAYAGQLTLDAVLTGTREQPIVTGNLLIANGRVRQLTYERFSGRVEYVGGMFEVGVRLDQSPGVWLTASGAVPLGLFDRTQPERPMYLAIASTPVSLGLIEGLTGVVHDVSGQVALNVSAVGTSHEPRFTGVVVLSDAGFVATSTGARYARGTGVIDLTTDRITVRDFRIEDGGGRVLDVTGSVGADDLQLQDLALEVSARGFEVLRNEYGTVNADARLALRGRVESPEISGTVTITGGQLRADRILDRVLFQPYAIEEPESSSPVDAIAALNPWDRLSLDVSVQVPNTLRLAGDNVQVASGTPLGLGNIDLRVAGAVRLRKGPAETLSVTGALDQITGRYAFQGRRFDLDPASSITFRGDLEPELQVTVERLISGVEVRVAISGPLSDPALQLTSSPPLDSSDILSLIVFNTTANQLSVAQQEQLAVRAGTLAAGFLAAPLVTALERSLGIDLLEIEAPDTGGARVTIGDEIAPGLVARFSRQFGADEYDEATLEYYLSRLFRIRATFSDAGSTIRTPFRRVERAGIDLLLFFSF